MEKEITYLPTMFSATYHVLTYLPCCSCLSRAGSFLPWPERSPERCLSSLRRRSRRGFCGGVSGCHGNRWSLCTLAALVNSVFREYPLPENCVLEAVFGTGTKQKKEREKMEIFWRCGDVLRLPTWRRDLETTTVMDSFVVFKYWSIRRRRSRSAIEEEEEEERSRCFRCCSWWWFLVVSSVGPPGFRALCKPYLLSSFINQKAQPTTTSVCACLPACMHDVEAKGVGLDRHRQETRQCTIQRSSHEPLTGNTPKIFSSFFLSWREHNFPFQSTLLFSLQYLNSFCL